MGTGGNVRWSRSPGGRRRLVDHQHHPRTRQPNKHQAYRRHRGHAKMLRRCAQTLARNTPYQRRNASTGTKNLLPVHGKAPGTQPSGTDCGASLWSALWHPAGMPTLDDACRLPNEAMGPANGRRRGKTESAGRRHNGPCHGTRPRTTFQNRLREHTQLH